VTFRWAPFYKLGKSGGREYRVRRAECVNVYAKHVVMLLWDHSVMFLDWFTITQLVGSLVCGLFAGQRTGLTRPPLKLGSLLHSLERIRRKRSLIEFIIASKNLIILFDFL